MRSAIKFYEEELENYGQLLANDQEAAYLRLAHIGICNTCRNAEAERKEKQGWIIIFFRGPKYLRSLVADH